jgi:hypothetical protein
LIHRFFKYLTKFIILFVFSIIQLLLLFILQEGGGDLFAFQSAWAKDLDDHEEKLCNFYEKQFLLNLGRKKLASVAYEAANI